MEGARAGEQWGMMLVFRFFERVALERENERSREKNVFFFTDEDPPRDSAFSFRRLRLRALRVLECGKKWGGEGN